MPFYMTKLQTGDKAPAFNALDQNGKEIKLKDLRGKRVVLYFYPNDDTPTCTKEACNLRDNMDKLADSGYTVIGVSRNSIKSHIKFAKKYNLPFSLLSDEDEQIVNDYDVIGEKKFMGRKFIGVFRVTFIINEKGYIERVIDNVKSGSHANQILSDGE